MRYRVFSLLVLAWLALYASMVPSLLLAQSNELPIVYHAATPLLPPATFGSTDRVALMIELADPPALSGGAGVSDRSARNRAAQERLLPMLAGRDAQVLFRTSLVYNGIAVSIPTARVADLKNLPNVVGMHIIPPKQLADVPGGGSAADAVAEAAKTWNSPLGATGQNVRIGVIDTGIDYTHATFGGPGTTAAYRAINPAQPATTIFPNAKVVGGYDFAGNNYDATGVTGSLTPQPDSNPLDCNGHGTRVASVLAGYGVTSQHKTYTGSYASPLNVQYFKVAPGIAPRANLYALKIFGCTGSSTLLTQAVEWALDPNGDGDPADRLDVLNISLSTPFGSNDDPDAVAINNAVAAGLLVVSSTGDVGGAFFAIASPGSAQRAITVGASSGMVAASANVDQSTAAVLPSSARGPQRGGTTLKPDLLAPGNGIVSAQVASGSNATVGSGPDIAVPQVTGAVALLRQLYPTWTALQIKAALLNTAMPVQADGVPAPPSLGGAGELNVLRLAGLDFLAYSRESNGGMSFGVTSLAQPTTLEQPVTLENLSDKERVLSVAASAVVTETGVSVEVPSMVTLPPHSTIDLPVRAAINPSALGHTPDAATPLLQSGFPRYFLAEHGGAVDITATIGTRLRVGHVADLPPVAFYLDDNLITGSIRTDNVGEFVAVPAGTHVLRVVSAGQPVTATPIVSQTVTLQTDQDYTFILVGREKAFGLDVINNTTEPAPANTALLQLNNANLPGDPESGPFDVYLDGTLTTAALAASASTGFIPIAPGKHVVTYYPAGKAPVFNNLDAIEEFDAQPGELLLVRTDRQGDEYNCPDRNRLCQAQQRGGLTRAPIRTPSVVAHVPYNVFPVSASEAHAAQMIVSVPAGSSAFTLPLQNTGARNSGLALTGYPEAQTPLVSAFALEATSPPNEALPTNLRAADIQYVGVTNSYSVSQALNNTDLFFGTSSYGAWATPHEVQMRIYLDVNNDGVDDYVLLNTDYGSALGLEPNDVFINAVYRIQPDGTLLGLTTYTLWGTFPAPSAPQGGIDVAAFNTSVMFQTVNTQSLGLATGQTQLSYHVETRARDANGFSTVVDRVPATGSLTYDIATAAVVPINTTGLLRQRPLFVDTDGGSITGLIGAGPTQPVAQGVLLLHHHNLASSQAEVVEVRRPAALELAPRLYIPFAAQQSS